MTPRALQRTRDGRFLWWHASNTDLAGYMAAVIRSLEPGETGEGASVLWAKYNYRSLNEAVIDGWKNYRRLVEG